MRYNFHNLSHFALSERDNTVRLIAPQFVKPYLKSKKNDANDAAAICEAVSRPHMRFVSAEAVEQQDLQAMHRIRSRLVGCRTQLSNQIRGLLAGYGIVLPQHLSQLRKALPQLTDERDQRLSGVARALISDLYEELRILSDRIDGMDKQLDQVYQTNPLCQQISAIEGIGPVIATAVVAAVGMPLLSRMGDNWPPSWDWFHGSTRAETNNGCSASLNVATCT